VHVFKKDHPQNSLKLHAIIDDQCNISLAGSGFFDHFCVNDETAANALSSGVGRIEITQIQGRKQVELTM